MKVILLRYGEIHLKGNNRRFFENALLKNIKSTLNGETFKLQHISGRYLITDYDEKREYAIIQKLVCVFGLHSISPAVVVENEPELILAECKKISVTGKFRVTTRRASKIFPIKSMQFSAMAGEVILDNCPNAVVDLHEPDTVINIDIRENGYTYISTQTIPCAGGMPVGTAGKGLLLLSGGIDSPVAGYFMAKRGMTIHALHFHSFPYTSELAKQKVITLAKLLSKYTGAIKLSFVSFTQVQEAINRNCDRDYMITIMRRIMMRISERLAKDVGAGAIITGESLGQVASQTLESITSTSAVTSMPIFRPLIGFDKLDIIDIARKIGTMETSILPYEDCCTVFLPKNPVTKPRLDRVEREESKLDIDKLVNDAYDSLETIDISPEY